MIARFDMVLRYRLSRPWETLLQILYLLFMSRWHTTLSIRITSRLNSFQTLRKFSVLRCREMKNRSTVSLSIFTSLVCRHPSIFVSFPIALPAIADFIVHRTHMGYINQTLIPSQILLQLPTVLWSSRFLLFCVENPLGRPPLFVKSRNAQRAIWYTGIPRIWLTV